MNKFNRKFNCAFERMSFWDSLSKHFSGFNNLLIARESLTVEDRKALFNIHKLLFECSRQANTRRNYHNKTLLNLRKNFTDKHKNTRN